MIAVQSTRFEASSEGLDEKLVLVQRDEFKRCITLEDKLRNMTRKLRGIYSVRGVTISHTENGHVCYDMTNYGVRVSHEKSYESR